MIPASGAVTRNPEEVILEASAPGVDPPLDSLAPTSAQGTGTAMQATVELITSLAVLTASSVAHSRMSLLEGATTATCNAPEVSGLVVAAAGLDGNPVIGYAAGEVTENFFFLFGHRNEICQNTKVTLSFGLIQLWLSCVL